MTVEQAPAIRRASTSRLGGIGSDFLWLICGQAASTLGDAFGLIAVAWLVYDLTGSLVALGTSILIAKVPEIGLRLLGGPMTDRIDRRLFLVGLDAVRAVAFASLGLAGALGALGLGHIFLAQFVIGAAGALYQPTLQALLPRLVVTSQLVRANAILSGVWQGTNVVGPALAGLLVATAGSFPALVVDAATFGLSAAALLKLPVATGVIRSAASGSYAHQLRAGFRFFAHVPALLILMIVLSISNIGSVAILDLLVPFVRDELRGDAFVVGLLQASVAVGFAVGMTAMIVRGDSRSRRPLLLGGLAVIGCAGAGLALVRPELFGVGMVLCGLVGLGQAVFIANSSAIYQQVVPDRLRGRVMAGRYLLAQWGNPLGPMIGALVAQEIGLRAMFVLAGVLPAALALLAFLLPALRALDGDLAPIEMAE